MTVTGSTIRRPVNRWSPPATMPVIPGAIITIPYIKPSGAVTKTDGPSIPGSIVHVKSPGERPWIIIATMPGPVIKTCSVNNSGTIHIGIQVTGCVACVDIIRMHIIDIHILHRIYGITGRDQVHFIRTNSTHHPWAIGRCRLKPHAIVHQEILSFIPDNSSIGIGGIIHPGTINRLKFRISIIINRGSGSSAVNLSCLRNFSIQQRILGSRCTCYTGQHIVFRRAYRNFCKILG